MLGIVILIVGLFFLFKNLGLITGDLWNILWPLLLIAVGLRIALKRNRCWCDWKGFGEEMHHKFHGHCHCKHEDSKDKPE